MNSSTPLVYSRLFLPHPLPAAQVAAFLTRLASDRNGHPVVLETRADEDGIQHLIGCEPTYVHQLRRMLADLIPGSIMTGLDGYARPTMIAAGHVAIQSPGLPLAAEDPEAVIRAVYSALGRPHKNGEAVCVQLVLGEGTAPRSVPAKISEPGFNLWQALTTGKPDASTEIRNRVRDRAAHYAIDGILRIGVIAHNSDKRRRTVMEILAAISIAQSPGVQIRLVKEDPNRLNMSPLTRRGVLRLAVPELVALSGWPIGEEQLPGMPPVHPKLLRADASVHTGHRVFAESLVPGDNRLLGVGAADGMYHGFALGPTGVGKTKLLEHLMEADIEAGHAVVVLDPKDQTPASLLERMPKKRWKDVVVIDGAEDEPIGFNPLDATGRDPDVVADGILAVFKRIFAEGWGPRTADIYSASLRTLARAGTPEAPNTLVDLPRLWTDPAFRRSQVAVVKDDVALMGFWSWYDSLRPAAQANVIAPPMNKLRQVLLRPAAVKILGQRKPGFRLKDVFRDRKVVLVPLNEGLVGPLTAELIGSLVIAEVWQAVQERAAEKGHEKRPGFVYVDEADRFLNLPVSLTDALARSRSLSVGWFLATQFFDQLPKDMKSAVKSNARTKVVFRLESDDDARTFARLAPELTDEDFMALGRYEVYLRLVADGITTGWALGKSLPPTPVTSDPDQVRRISRQHHRPDPADDTLPPIDTVPPSGDVDAAQAAPVVSSGPIGRRRRNT
ncbi:MAG: type IV secretory system conjugative DNA transfer family protein [Dehalococcoidia bacterium]